MAAPITSRSRKTYELSIRFRAIGYGAVLAMEDFALIAAVTYASLAIGLLGIGVGIVITPPAIEFVRRLANRRRRTTLARQGMAIPDPYRPRPTFPAGFAGRVQRCVWLLSDPATWRDLAWTALEPSVGCILALIPLTLILEGIWGTVITILWKPLTNAGMNDYFLFVHVSKTSSYPSFIPAMLTVPLIIGGLWCSSAMLRVHARWTRLFLAPAAGAELAQRVDHLTVTRTDAVDTSAAEIRRIERDLHDGAQARLVAMGMNLNAVAQLLDKNPEAARGLLMEARDATAKALTEIRDLVRGIHPPVLADRGLVDAVRALALDSALDVTVTADPIGRLAAPLESAAYFAIGEILTNAAKHAHATRVWIEVRLQDGVLRLSVADDGVGGANASKGTGIRGIERRLATFDGILAVTSPEGGPTIVTMELPCASSSLKTSTS